MEKFLRRDLIATRTSSEKSFLYSTSNENLWPISTKLAELVMSCEGAHPLEEHARRCADRFGLSVGDRQKLELDFRSLVSVGVFVSSNELLTHIVESEARNEEEAKEKISSLVIPTKDRPEALRRCLRSYLEQAREYGHELTIVVSDDSTLESSREQNLEILKDFSNQYCLPARYCDASERARFVKKASRKLDLSDKLLRFALEDPFGLGYTPGASRNALLLDTLGEKFVSVDDDTCCEPTLLHETFHQIRLGESHRGRLKGFVDGAELTRSTIAAPSADFFREHQEWLGRSLAEPLKKFSAKDAELSHLGAASFKDMWKGHSRIAITRTGLCGDSGTDGPFFYFWADERENDWNFRGEEEYQAIMRSRQSWHGVDCYSVAPAGSLMTTAFGADNRFLLPPFVPVFRGEDSVFGALLRSCFSHCYAAWLPFAVRHTPWTSRRDEPDAFLRLVSAVSFDTLIQICLAEPRPRVPKQKPGDALICVGNYFKELSLIDGEDFQRFLLLRSWKELSSTIEHLEQRLSGPLPNFVQRDIKRCIEEAERVMLTQGFGLPVELEPQANEERAIRITQNLLGYFGELLSHWSAIVEGCTRLKKEGIRVSRLV